MTVRIHHVNSISSCTICVRAMTDLHLRIFSDFRSTSRALNLVNRQQYEITDKAIENGLIPTDIRTTGYYQMLKDNSRRFTLFLKFIRRAHNS